MKERLSYLLLIVILGLGGDGAALAARASIPERVGSPYLSALVVNTGTGAVFFEDNADAPSYPASIVKLMMLLILQEKIDAGTLRLEDPVRVTAEASRIGGSQVYLKEHEIFSVEELLYSLIIQSANDSAVALATHVAGSPEAFVRLMQERAERLGMTSTSFRSVHGLPPAARQEPDTTTARDLAKLALELARHPDIFRYTSAIHRPFRNASFEMRSHNHLLGSLEGCDGLKTGYFKLGGYSIVASASRRGTRFLAIVLGSKTRQERDAKARELLTKAFSSTILPPPTPDHPSVARPVPVLTPAGPDRTPAAEERPVPHPSGGYPLLVLLPILVVVAGFFFWLGSRRR